MNIEIYINKYTFHLYLVTERSLQKLFDNKINFF